MNRMLHIILSSAFLIPTVSLTANFWTDLCGSFEEIVENNRPTFSRPSNHQTSWQNHQAPKPHSTYFSAHKAHEYVTTIIASFEHSLRPHLNSSYLRHLKQLIHQQIAGKRFSSKDEVDQLIASAVLDFIQTTAYQYTLDRTGNCTIAHRISTSMFNNALSTINQRGYVDAEIIIKFAGYALVEAVDYEMALIASIQPQSAPVYASQDCCVCTENFNDVQRIYLTPCGHDICADCAYTWFFTQQKTSCPLCRSTINKIDLANALRC